MDKQLYKDDHSNGVITKAYIVKVIIVYEPWRITAMAAKKKTQPLKLFSRKDFAPVVALLYYTYMYYVLSREFLPWTINDWNNLPNNIIKSNTLDHFTLCLKSYNYATDIQSWIQT